MASENSLTFEKDYRNSLKIIEVLDWRDSLGGGRQLSTY